MRYRALACDYDGTLATHGKVVPETVAALTKLLASGRRLILVTGRELDELLGIFPEIGLFEWVVAENGALLYRPASREERPLCPPPPAAFVAALRQRNVTPISVGRVVVATWQPHEQEVLATIRDLGLELQVIFNKGAVMVLPAGINKASGLAAALKVMELSPHEVAGVGDAENDHALLALCECGVAVANALPALKDRADLVTDADHGAGVAELIDKLVANDLAEMKGRLPRHHLLLGQGTGGDVLISPYGPNMLISGPSGSGKSTVAACLLDRFVGHQYQFCVIDPQGAFSHLKAAVVLEGPKEGATIDEALQVLKHPADNVVVNLAGLPLAERPAFFVTLLSRLQEMRVRTGRPHWLLADEAHQLLPAAWKPAELSLPQELMRTIFITAHPEQLAPAVLSKIGTLLIVGAAPERTLSQFCHAIDIPPPQAETSVLQPGEALVWLDCESPSASVVRIEPSKLERKRQRDW